MSSSIRVGAAIALMAVALTLSSVIVASAAPVRFGANLAGEDPQPAQWCDEPNEIPPHPTCTWIMNTAPGQNARTKAPKAGVIGRVRLKSCEPGKLRIQVARKVAGTNRFKVVRNGPTIEYQGDPGPCSEDFEPGSIESFATSFRVSKGDRIAIRAKRTGTLRCGNGGDNTWLLTPPLVAGGASRVPTDSEDCQLMVQWQYR